jgi:exopolysaccharide production protein ExoZ
MAFNPIPLSAAQKPAPSRKYASLQVGRAIAALLVVLHHVSSFVGGEPHLWVHPAIGQWFAGTSLGVSFFFVLSGIVILTAHWKDIGNPGKVLPYLGKRFRRIYPIYWVVLALVLCGQLRHVDPGFPFHRDPYVILSSILLVHIHSSETNLVVAWTLFHEIAFYAVFALALLHKRIGTCLIALWLAASLFSFHSRGSVYDWSFFASIHILFAFGMAAAWILRQKRVPLPGLLLIAGSFLFFGVIAYTGSLGYISEGTYLASGFGSMLALLGASELERLERLHVPQFLIFLGDASYAIYLLHYPVISHLAPICFRLDAHLHLPIALWMLLLIAIGTAAGCLLHVAVERPLLDWLRRADRQSSQSVAQTA